MKDDIVVEVGIELSEVILWEERHTIIISQCVVELGNPIGLLILTSVGISGSLFGLGSGNVYTWRE